MNPRFTSNLQAIRLFAAYLVLFRHSFILFGKEEVLREIPLVSLGGLWIFFAISGYLLPGSWSRNPNWGTYAKARFRRLFPPLAAVVLLSVFLLGPLFTTISRWEYLFHPQTWSYLLNLVLHPMYFLPGVFADNHYPYAVNGSLWSIPPQVLAYVLIPLVFLLRNRAARATAWALILLFTLWDRATDTFAETVVWGSNASQVLAVIAVFAAGAFLRESRIKLHVGVAIVVLVLLVGGSWLFPALQFYLVSTTLPYVVMTFGLRSWPVLRSANRIPDISYGVFLVGFPAQQSVIAFAPTLHPALSILAAAVISTAAALALERFVERPILARAERRESARRSPGRP